MFEYLMPLLVMPIFEHTLLDQTYRAVVDRQIEYGGSAASRGESPNPCYNATDVAVMTTNTAPSACRGSGLSADSATIWSSRRTPRVLALMVAPGEACENLQRLAESGFLGRYGFYEAIDYTPRACRRGKTVAIVTVLHGPSPGDEPAVAGQRPPRIGPCRRRFMSDPICASDGAAAPGTRAQRSAPVCSRARPSGRRPAAFESGIEAALRVFTDPNTPSRRCISCPTAVPRHDDRRRRRLQPLAGPGRHPLARGLHPRLLGDILYLSDLAGELWSAAYQPTLSSRSRIRGVFASRPGRSSAAAIADFETHTEITVSPEDDVEIRRLRITNLSDNPRRVELTSYAEVVLAASTADLAHRVFSNLFVADGNRA